MAALAVFMTSCATLSDIDTRKLAVQYGTLKLIEQSGNVTAQGVLDATSKVRETIQADASVDLTELIAGIDTSGLSPSDQLLVSALSEQIRYAVIDLPDIESRAERLLTVLDIVDAAARIAGGQ